MIFIRSDLSLRQRNKNVSVIFILAEISLAYCKQKISLSGGLKFPLEIIESHYKACTMKLLWVAPINYYKHVPTQSSTFPTSAVTQYCTSKLTFYEDLKHHVINFFYVQS